MNTKLKVVIVTMAVLAIGVGIYFIRKNNKLIEQQSATKAVQGRG